MQKHKPLKTYRSGWMLAAVLAMLLAAGGAVRAQDAVQKSCDWHYELDLVVWGAGLKGTVGPEFQESQVTMSAKDLFSHLDMAGQLHFEANDGTWGILVDPFYVSLGDSAQLANGYPAHVKLKELIGGLAGSYRLYKSPAVLFDLTFGGRYNQITTDITPDNLPTTSQGITWIDPVIGFRVGVQMSKIWSFGLRADVGGFDVGSKLTWSGAVRFDARVSRCCAISLGYINLYNDYVKGRGFQNPGKFEYAMNMGGPYLGVAFKF